MALSGESSGIVWGSLVALSGGVIWRCLGESCGTVFGYLGVSWYCLREFRGTGWGSLVLLSGII